MVLGVSDRGSSGDMGPMHGPTSDSHIIVEEEALEYLGIKDDAVADHFAISCS